MNPLIIPIAPPYRDGTTHLLFEPLDFISRLASLVPPPRRHLIRFHGVFAPNHHARARIVPRPRVRATPEDANTPAERRAAMTWAQRLKRVFQIDITRCPHCQGPLAIISCIDDPDVIQKILTHRTRTAADPTANRHGARAPPPPSCDTSPFTDSEAQRYIEADVSLFLSRPDEATIAPRVKTKEEVREALAQTSVPKRADVLAALDSNDEGTRRAALVFAIVHRWVDDEVLRGVINHYEASGAFFSRYYSMRVFMLAEPARIRQHSRDISQILMSERDEGPRQIAMTFVPWLERKDALSVLLLYMRTGSPTLQRAGWAAAQAINKEFVDRLRLEVRRSGYHDALRVMDLLDAGRGR